MVASGAAAEVVPDCPVGSLGGGAPGKLELGDGLLNRVRIA
jgi:hypothetical protein